MIFYLFIGIFEILFSSLLNNFHEFRLITKPLLMIALGFYVHDNLPIKYALPLFFILFFAWLGDLFLMFSAPIFFPLGLGSFLVMQLLYIRHFVKNIRIERINWRADSWVAVLFLTYVFLFLKMLWPGVGQELKIPVVLYGLALGSMAFFAFIRKSYDQHTSYWMIFLGAIFFVLSDSLLAYNKFVSSFSENSFSVMGTYILAQLLLSVGLVNFAIRK